MLTERFTVYYSLLSEVIREINHDKISILNLNSTQMKHLTHLPRQSIVRPNNNPRIQMFVNSLSPKKR